MAFGGVLLFNFFLMIVLVAALFGGISIIAAAVMGITHFIHKKTGKPAKKLFPITAIILAIAGIIALIPLVVLLLISA